MKYKVEVKILGGDYCRDDCGNMCDFFWESEDGDTGCCLLSEATFIEGDMSNVPKFENCPSLVQQGERYGRLISILP